MVIDLPDHSALAALLPEPETIGAEAPVIPLHCVHSVQEAFDALPAQQSALENWAKVQGFEGRDGQVLLLPNGDGAIVAALIGCSTQIDGRPSPGFDFGGLTSQLPGGTYTLQTPIANATLALTAFLLGWYTYTRFKGRLREDVILVTDQGDRALALCQARAVMFGRDLINTPANLLGPADLAESACGLAAAYGAKVSVIEGEALLDSANPFPLVYAVGAAANQTPRLVDFRWSGGEKTAATVTLVGKGVCFDTGGLNIKPGNSMALMKKDMGGAAAVLALAFMIMDRAVPVNLRVLVPCVENSIASQAFRPGDVLTSRKGLSVDIGNTDAEGRLILADALALADEDAPDLLIDMATLTGAARVALGPDLPPFFTDDETLASDLSAQAATSDDPVWRLPLWDRYDKAIAGKVGDLSNTGNMPFAGAITAALFLRRFVSSAKSWVHIDIFGWTPSARPGRPEGGEVQAVRALFNLIEQRYGSKD